MPQISLIIPVYNTEAYLAKCLTSALAQTFTDIEVICVDSSSTDGSAAVLQNFAAKDPRVKVFTVPNEGPGIGRNKGLDEARGKYILFLDSDDFLDTRACEILYNAAETERLDIAACDFYTYQDKTGVLPPLPRAGTALQARFGRFRGRRAGGICQVCLLPSVRVGQTHPPRYY